VRPNPRFMVVLFKVPPNTELFRRLSSFPLTFFSDLRATQDLGSSFLVRFEDSFNTDDRQDAFFLQPPPSLSESSAADQCIPANSDSRSFFTLLERHAARCAGPSWRSELESLPLPSVWWPPSPELFSCAYTGPSRT